MFHQSVSLSSVRAFDNLSVLFFLLGLCFLACLFVHLVGSNEIFSLGVAPSPTLFVEVIVFVVVDVVWVTAVIVTFKCCIIVGNFHFLIFLKSNLDVQIFLLRLHKNSFFC